MNNFEDTLEKHTEVIQKAINELLIPDLESAHTWKSDWLINDLESPIWLLKKNRSFFNDDSGNWEKTIPIYWNTTLPNGKKLTDKTYRSLLQTMRKIVFLARQGYAFLFNDRIHLTETSRSQQQSGLARSLILITKWMIIKGYQPELYGFKILTEEDIKLFVSEARFGSQMVDGTYQIIDSFLNHAKSNNSLHKYLVDGRVDYPKVCKEAGLVKGGEISISPSTRLQTVINKDYETVDLPEWNDYRYCSGRELLSHRAVKFKDAGTDTVSESNLDGMLTGIRTIGRFASVLTDELGGLSWCAELNTPDLIRKYGYKKKNRTPTIPIETALEYLDKCIAWVSKIGPDLVVVKHNCDAQLNSLMKGKRARKDHFAKKVNLNLCSELEEELAKQNLRVTRYNANPTNKNNAYIRDNLSIEESIECLVAACFIIISTFSCKRVSEVLDLTVNCSRPALDGGWELVFGLRKASPVEALSFAGRPVPEIVQEAVDLLIKLQPDDITAQDKKTKTQPLFLSTYKTSRNTYRAKHRAPQKMYKSIELFADIIQIQTTLEGKRWYIRSHECRRFFAIAYFWHKNFSGLPALSWFMGHDDIEATMRYVTEEIPGSEMSEEEARFTAYIMQQEEPEQIPGLVELTKDAQLAFNTENLKIINKNDLEDYLKMRFDEGYQIIKHGHKSEVIYLEEYR